MLWKFNQGKKKGVVAEFLGYIILAFLTGMAFLTLPNFFQDIQSLFNLQSADAVSRDLSSLMTLSHAVIGESKFNYKKTEACYNVKIEDKLVNVSLIEFKVRAEGIEGEGVGRTIDKGKYGFDSVNSFVIEKIGDRVKVGGKKCEG